MCQKNNHFTLYKEEKIMKKHLPKLKTFAFLNLGILLTTIGIYFFKTPNSFSVGGVSGLSIILARLLPITTPAIYMLVINVFLLILGVIILGKRCGGLTIYCSLMISFENWLFEQLIPLNGTLTSFPLLELVYSILLMGIGSAILFKCHASSGGTDILALILKKFTNLNVSTSLLCTDMIIAIAAFLALDANGNLTIDAQTGLFSLLGLFAKVFVIDDIIDSINMCKAFTIITTKPDEINSYIMQDIRHGVTTYPAKGAYTGADKTVIITVCRRSEAIRLRRKVLSIDPHAFIIITKTSEILGKGFRDEAK